MAVKTVAHVGVCELTLRLFGIESLKAKRGIARSLIARIHNRFNVSVSEVHFLDSKELLGIGLACVSNSRPVIDSLFAQVVRFMEEDRRFEIESYSTTFV